MNFELRHPQPPAPLLPASQSCDLNGKGADAFILFVTDTNSNVAYYLALYLTWFWVCQDLLIIFDVLYFVFLFFLKTTKAQDLV